MGSGGNADLVQAILGLSDDNEKVMNIANIDDSECFKLACTKLHEQNRNDLLSRVQIERRKYHERKKQAATTEFEKGIDVCDKKIAILNAYKTELQNYSKELDSKFNADVEELVRDTVEGIGNNRSNQTSQKRRGCTIL